MGSFRFPPGDSAQIPGFDGLLVARGVAPFVPDGESVWEFGTGSDYVGKADKDYEARSINSRGIKASDATFVFVTPRIWKSLDPSPREWEKRKAATGTWKNVQVIDAVALEEWLYQHPPVAARVARQILHLVPQTGARSTDEFWEEYALRFQPELSQKLLICGRSKQANELLQQLVETPQIFRWQADSQDEVIAFAVAAIRDSEVETRKLLEARTLVVETEGAARFLRDRSNLTFFVRAGALGSSGMLAKQHVVIVPLGREAPRHETSTVLKRPTTHEFSQALEVMGMREEEAIRKARMCSRSLTILARLIPSATAIRPEWSNDPDLVPALLAGGWDAGSEEDRKIVQVLANSSTYEEYESRLRGYVRIQDPPLEHEGTVWKVRAPVDALGHLAHLVGSEHLARLEAVCGTVFLEVNPSIDLPPQERPYAELSGKKLRHSAWLRDGLATTLLLFAVLGEGAELEVSGGPQAYVDRLISNLPGLQTDWRLHASLADQYPLLMEAAPRPLVRALEQMLGGDGSTIRPIFRDTDALFSSSPHTGLLWGLEVVAWDPEYLARVSLILARLARIDPGGKLANRPMNSLREIFLPWHPNTNASLAQRLAALDYVIDQEPEVGWKLVLMLLPEYHSVAQNTAVPRFRDSGASEKEGLSRQVIWEGYSQAIQRALTLADNDPSRWVAIIQKIPMFAPEHRDRACDLLENFSRQADTGQRTVLWSALLNLVNRHKAFQNAAWSMKEPELKRLEQIAQHLEPSDPLVRIAWLFNEHHPTVPGPDPIPSLDAVDTARDKAIRDLFDMEGGPAIVSFANSVALPRYVAYAAAKVIESIAVFDVMVDLSMGKGERLEEFALVLSGQAERKFKQDWQTRILARTRENRSTPEQVVTLLLDWPDEPATWEFVRSTGSDIERSYWRRKTAWTQRGNIKNIETAARNYLSVGRAMAALEVVHNDAKLVSPEIIFEALDKAIGEFNSATSRISGMTFYELGLIFDALAERDDVPVVEVAKREYAYLPLLQHSRRNLTLHRMMAANPEFFVSVLCDVFKPATGEPTEPTAERRVRARMGYGLLSEFELLPGLDRENIDPAVLRIWVADVRRRAAEVDRVRIAEEYIGHLLAHAPYDADGAWPHSAVREVLEEIKSDGVERGIEIERFNMRGAFTKAMYEGGTQERSLADQARNSAKSLARWPRTQGLLMRIAQSWDATAEQADQMARQDEMKFES